MIMHSCIQNCHFFLKGSVIPFVSIKEIHKYLFESSQVITDQPDAFKKNVQALELLDLNEKKLQKTLDVLQKTRLAIIQQALKKTAAPWAVFLIYFYLYLTYKATFM